MSKSVMVGIDWRMLPVLTKPVPESVILWRKLFSSQHTQALLHETSNAYRRESPRPLCIAFGAQSLLYADMPQVLLLGD